MKKYYEDHFNFLLTPLIDVLLFILIFFMVSYNYSVNVQSIELPSSNTSERESHLDKVTILEILQDKSIFINGKKIEGNALKTELGILDKNNPVILRADKTLTYQYVLNIMDIVKQIGIQKIYLATV